MTKTLYKVRWNSYVYVRNEQEAAHLKSLKPYKSEDDAKPLNLTLDYALADETLDIALYNPMDYRYFEILSPVVLQFDATLDDSVKAVEALCSRLERAADIATRQDFNVKCNVHIGGSLLMSVNQLMLAQDSCTDALQNYLNQGWRILSINVQPDQRRSDFVLGRYNPNAVLDTVAERG